MPLSIVPEAEEVQISTERDQLSCAERRDNERRMRPNLTDLLNAVASVFIVASLSLVRYYLQGTHSVIGRA
jgi:hypothetical protein